MRFTAENPGRLDHALRQRLDLSNSRIRSLIVNGAVTVDGRAVRRPAWDLLPGSRVEVEVPEPEAPTGPPAIAVLYRDDDLLAVDKPPGLPMHANLDPSRPNLVALLAQDYLGIHQRLDKDTSGVVLFARSTRANAGLARQFEERRVRKVYHALTVRGPGPRQWTETRPLGTPARRGGRVPVVESGTPAETDFTRLKTLPHALLVEARPRTGRKHQIRAHLAAAGLPLLGDVLYGGPPAERVMLHAVRLELLHPVTGAPLRLESPHPADFRRAMAGPCGPPPR